MRIGPPRRLRRRAGKPAAVVGGALATAVVALLCATTGASAPAKAPPASPIKALVNSLQGLSPRSREATLLAQARREGKVDLYTSLSTLVVKPLQAAWAKRYPDVQLDVYRAGDEDIAARVLAERKAGASGADVIETNGTTMLIFQHLNDVLVPYTRSPYRSAVPKTYRFVSFTGDRTEKFVVAWNTNLVSSPPTSFGDLAQGNWKGRLTLEPTDVDWFAALYGYFRTQKRYSARKADALFKAIAANSQLVSGHTAQANFLAAGQVAVIVDAHAAALEQLIKKKAPIDFGPPFVTPVLERPQGIGVSYRLPHPAAALLYYDWLLSPEAQRVMLDNGVTPARKGFADSTFASNPLTIKMDLRPIVSHYKAWTQKYASITGVG